LANEPIDPETLAALLDGTLDPAERERVLAQIAQSDESYELLIESGAITAELEGDEERETPRPPLTILPPPSAEPQEPVPRAPRRRAWMAVAPVLLAAAVVGVWLVSPRSTASTDLGAPLDAAARVAVARGGIGPAFGNAWGASPRPRATRGANTSPEVRARAFALGARHALVEIALASGDTATARAEAEPVLEMVRRLGTGGVVAEGVARRLSGSGDRDALLHDLRDVSGAPEIFDAGVWSATARLAAAAGDVTFFESSGPSMQALSGVVDALSRTTEREEPDVAAASALLRALSRRERITAPQLPSVVVDVDSVGRLLAR
jgi:hypothetical protein